MNEVIKNKSAHLVKVVGNKAFECRTEGGFTVVAIDGTKSIYITFIVISFLYFF